jgi:hypothetical protein
MLNTNFFQRLFIFTATWSSLYSLGTDHKENTAFPLLPRNRPRRKHCLDITEWPLPSNALSKTAGATKEKLAPILVNI